MEHVTVGSKYQIVIPKEVRRRVRGLHPGTKVVVGMIKADTITVKKVRKNWVAQTRGLARRAWSAIDTTKHLEELRNEWNRAL